MTTVVVQDGRTMNYTAGSDVSAGDVIEFAGCIGVALADIASGETGALLMMGVVTLTKETGTAWTQGDALYWDATNNRLDKTNTNIPAGICWEDAASGDATGKVSLIVGALHES